MISAKPTENLTGITIEGSYDDLTALVESIHRMTGIEEDYDDYYWSVKNRLLGVCYDIRHAAQGDREVKLTDNGVDDEMMRWHSMILPRQGVRFSVNILFPEAVFVALSAPELYLWSGCCYGRRSRRRKEEGQLFKYADFFRDRAAIDYLVAAVFAALAEVIGDDELEQLLRQKERCYDEGVFFDYAAQYVDRCNIEYLKTAPDKRKDKLRNIAKRFIKPPQAYYNMRSDLEYWAREYRCSIHEIEDPRMEYPEDIEW